ncbi:MAG: hypothetical protein JO249_09560 [Acidobacteria bacterium]|nr:hypothetical protein [Acidobacteriota bacterium]MBV9480987.1 hypothetical protein [Acidobacteriota bacterium]
MTTLGQRDKPPCERDCWVLEESSKPATAASRNADTDGHFIQQPFVIWLCLALLQHVGEGPTKAQTPLTNALTADDNPAHLRISSTSRRFAQVIHWTLVMLQLSTVIHWTLVMQNLDFGDDSLDFGDEMPVIHWTLVMHHN